MTKKKAVEGFQPGARPLCAFCGAQWTDEMVKVRDINAFNDPEGFGPTNERATVDIACEHCHRLIYRKEFNGCSTNYGEENRSYS